MEVYHYNSLRVLIEPLFEHFHMETTIVFLSRDLFAIYKHKPIKADSIEQRSIYIVGLISFSFLSPSTPMNVRYKLLLSDISSNIICQCNSNEQAGLCSEKFEENSGQGIY